MKANAISSKIEYYEKIGFYGKNRLRIIQYLLANEIQKLIELFMVDSYLSVKYPLSSVIFLQAQ